MKLRWRLWIFRTIAAGMGILASLLLGELFLRVQEPFTHFLDHNFSKNPYITSEIWHHWPQPGISLKMGPLDPPRYPKPYSYATNQFGCRHPQHLAVPKPKGVRRILILGDSFTEGDYDEDTVALRLEARLKKSGGGSQVEVVNCGCASYSPLLEYLRLKNQLLEMEPDEIILNIDQTDIFDDYWRYRPFLRVSPDNEPLGVGQPFTLKRRVVKWLELRSDLGRFLSGLRWRWMTRSEGRGTQASTEKPRAPTQANIFMYQSTLPVDSSSWQLEVGYCLGNIARIIRHTRQRGIPLTITMYPHRQQLRPDPGEKLWNREFEFRVERLCLESGADFFSAFDGIASAYRANPDIYWASDMHFTPEGARIWADLVTDYYLAHQPGAR
jgi:lysophospholipase L1-like esterase